MEVNTRLQVEHPVTEEITGLDLVREQIRVAEGEVLGYEQDDLTINGHAIEARLYAEDPGRQFLPSPGRVVIWEPASSTGVRYDTGIESGSDIGIDFDPMLAKVIVHAATRKDAIRRLARALEETRIEGLVTNRDFLVACLRTPEFLAGDTQTDFIERVHPAQTRQPDSNEVERAAIAVCLASQCRRRNNAKVLGRVSSGWRNSVMPPQSTTFHTNEEDCVIEYSLRRDGMFEVGIDSRVMNCEIHHFSDSGNEMELELSITGERSLYRLLRDGDKWYTQSPRGSVSLQEHLRFPLASSNEAGGGLMAPMPGNVLAIMIDVGERVEKGQTLLILEAMKMEHPVQASINGVVSAIKVAVGEQVDNNQSLIVLEEETNGG